MTTPDDFSIYSPDFRILTELAKQVCHALVVYARLEAIAAAGLRQDVAEGQRLGALQGMNDYALLMHAHRTLRWLGIAKHKGLVERTIGTEIQALGAAVKLLRNKREHLEEYLDPAKSRQHHAKEKVAPNAFFMTPPEWSSSINGVRRLGGRVEVARLGAAVESLRCELVAIDRWTLSWTPSELIETERQISAKKICLNALNDTDLCAVQRFTEVL